MKNKFPKKFEKFSLKNNALKLYFSGVFIAHQIRMKKKSHTHFEKKKVMDFSNFFSWVFQIYPNSDPDFQTFQFRTLRKNS